MKSIFDYVKAKALAAYWNTKQAESGLPPFLGEVLFPNRKQMGLELSWIKGAKGMPVELNLSAFDSDTLKKDRIGFEAVNAKMPFFKNSLVVDEELRQKLLLAMQAGNEQYVNTILRNIFDDATMLIEDAAVTREKMRMQLLSTGVITMANNGQEYKYDYGIDASHKVTSNWAADNADPVADIIAWQDITEAEGYGRPTRAITSRKVLRQIMKNASIMNAVYVFGQGKVTLDEATLRAYIEAQTGVRIEVYEKKYKALNGTVTRFIPEDLFILIPDGELGYTNFGTTPEEADLMSSNKANVALVDTGVAVTTWAQEDPVNVTTKVSEICLPSFEAADQIIIADVLANPSL